MFRFRDTFLLFFQLNTQHTHYSKRGFFAFSMNGKLEGLGEDQPELGGGEVETLSKKGSIREHPATPQIPHSEHEKKSTERWKFQTRFIYTRDEK